MLRSTLHQARPHLSQSILLAAVLWLCAGCSTPTHVLLDRGEEAYQRKQFIEAAGNFEQAVKQSPTRWEPHYLLGLTRLAQEQYYPARVELDKAWAMRPPKEKRPHVLDALAEAYFQGGDNEGLFTLLNRAVALYGTPEDTLRQARYLAKMGDTDNASVAFDKAIRTAHAGDPQPMIEAADFYQSIGDTPREIIALRKAYHVKPGNRDVAERLRKHGIVPGPTVGLPRDR